MRNVRTPFLGAALLTLVACRGESPTDPGDTFAYDVLVERREQLTGPADIFVLDLATGEATRLLASNVRGMHPSASLDGTRIAFVRNDVEFVNEVFIASRDGTGLTNVSNHAASDIMAAISPPGGRVAFVTDRAGFQDIFVVNSDGTGLRRITDVDPAGGVTTEWWPAWSHDGQRLAYSSTIDGTPDIWTTTVDGPPFSRARVTGTPDTDLHPTWSPEGTHIAFERRNATTGEVDIVILTLSSGTTQTISLPGQQLTPAWSPDGTLIAFASNHENVGADLEIYTMARNGTNIVRRTDNGQHDLRPAWLLKP